MSEPILQVKNLIFNFNSRRIFSGVGFDVKSGSITCLIGPSGCGKTTLLRILAGLLPKERGEIYFKGNKAEDVPIHKRDMGFIFQSENALFPHLSVRQNIEFPFRHGRKQPPNGDDRNSSVNKMLDRTELTAHANSKISELSGGLKQRVAIARALVYKPELLLLDEPLSSLDNAKKTRLRELLLEYKNERPKNPTFLYVTHDEREVREMADFIIVLNEGKIIQQGSKEEVFCEPKNSVVKMLLNIK